MDILEVKQLDHLGLVMGTLREYGVIDLIDLKLGVNEQHKISTGEIVAAMVINGLGFFGRPLSLTPQFFESKALDVIFDKDVTADDFNRHRLGRALDDIHAYGCELLFSEIAMHVSEQLQLSSKFQSVDTTSFSLTGEYDVDTDENTIEITHGYSKDHRPDLKQVVLELLTSHDGGIPLMMKCFDGNASDNKIFKERCSKLLSEFKKGEEPPYLVGDSKLYHEANADNLSKMKFITRIPRIYKEELSAITEAVSKDAWIVLDEENRYYEYHTNHLNITQRWFVIYSDAANIRSTKTIDKEIKKEFDSLEMTLKHLRNEAFDSESAAKKAIEKLLKKLSYHKVDASDVISRDCYDGAGRPKKDEQPTKTIYKIDATITFLPEEKQRRLDQKSCFIIGTNVDENKLSAMETIEAYKNQNASIERGFRFLKDPMFFVSSSKGLRLRPSGRGFLSVKIRFGRGSFPFQHKITEAQPKSFLTFYQETIKSYVIIDGNDDFITGVLGCTEPYTKCIERAEKNSTQSN